MEEYGAIVTINGSSGAEDMADVGVGTTLGDVSARAASGCAGAAVEEAVAGAEAVQHESHTPHAVPGQSYMTKELATGVEAALTVQLLPGTGAGLAQQAESLSPPPENSSGSEQQQSAGYEEHLNMPGAVLQRLTSSCPAAPRSTS